MSKCKKICQLKYVENSDIFEKDVSLEPTDYIIIAKEALKNTCKAIDCESNKGGNCPGHDVNKTGQCLSYRHIPGYERRKPIAEGTKQL